jgi:hypothetical protein
MNPSEYNYDLAGDLFEVQPRRNVLKALLSSYASQISDGSGTCLYVVLPSLSTKQDLRNSINSVAKPPLSWKFGI